MSEEISVQAPSGAEKWKDPVSRALEILSEPTDSEKEVKLVPFALPGEGEFSTLADLGVALTAHRQKALEEFEEITGLPPLPTPILEFERVITQLLVAPLAFFPIPFEPKAFVEAIPVPSDFLRSKETKTKEKEAKTKVLPSTKVEAKRELEEIAIAGAEPKLEL